MPRARKTEDMSLPTINKWLQIYLVEVGKKIDDGTLPEATGRQIARGLKHSIKYLDKSYQDFKAAERASFRNELEAAKSRF